MGRQARGDALALAPGGFDARSLGTQGALDVFGQTIPQQLSAFQQGNMGAQQALLGGMPQFQNAIMGLPVDYGAMQPRAVQYDPSFAQQQVPQFQSIADLLGGGAAQQTGVGGGGYSGYGGFSGAGGTPGGGGKFHEPPSQQHMAQYLQGLF
jgi:hypothetical protein